MQNLLKIKQIWVTNADAIKLEKLLRMLTYGPHRVFFLFVYCSGRQVVSHMKKKIKNDSIKRQAKHYDLYRDSRRTHGWWFRGLQQQTGFFFSQLRFMRPSILFTLITKELVISFHATPLLCNNNVRKKSIFLALFTLAT